MSRLLAFLGGAAEGLSSEIEKAEKSAKEEAMLRVKQLSESYEETRKSNRELTNALNAEKDWITTTYANATPEQVAYLQSSPAALQALKKMKDPTKISLSDVISIASGNESNALVAERITDMPEVADKVAAAVKKQYRSGLGGFIDRVGEGAGETAERRFARAMGTDIETMQTTNKLERPTMAGTFDMAKVFETTPSSMDEIIKTGEAARFQAGRKFGKDSQEYRDADATVKEAQSEIVKADKKLEDRRDRLEIQRNDSKDDPILVAALTKEINGINADIKARREATSTKSERAGTGGSADAITYAKAKTRVEDYMNTDMITNKGLGWRKYVEEKVVTDPATGKSITIPGKKVGLNPEQEKEYIEGMTQARMQGLKDLGLVTTQGRPVNAEVGQLMTAYGLNRPAQTTAPVQTTGQTTTPAQAPKSAVSVDAARAEARAAIAKGANAAAVAKRFKETTGQEL
jgi:hypothetical protein